MAINRRRVRNRAVAVEELESRLLLTAVPSNFDQYMLELINRARANPAAEATRLGINLNEGLAAGTISTAAKQPLAFNPDLLQSSQDYTTALLGAYNYFDHFYNSTDPESRMKTAGYLFSGSWTEGENIDVQESSGSLPLSQSITNTEYNDLFIDSGVTGRGHRLNLMDASFKEIGIGVLAGSNYQGLDSPPDHTAWNGVITTQDFAASGADANPFLTGVAFNDSVVKDNFYEPGEGLGNITITATRASDGKVFSTTTWASGGYSLEVPNGTYTVTATGAGLGGTVTKNSVVVSNLNVEVDFTPQAPQTASISGTVFHDANDNHKQDPGEGGLAGWVVYIDVNDDGKYDRGDISTTTDKHGNWSFKNLDTGTYIVRIVSQRHHKTTAPVSPDSGYFKINLGAGKASTGNLFGET